MAFTLHNHTNTNGAHEDFALSPVISMNNSETTDTLSELRRRILEMGSMTEELVGDAIRALTEQDAQLAATIMPRDDMVDRMDIEIEAMCLRLLAVPNPTPEELRLVGAAMKVITDIERIGDHAVDIAKISQRMARELFYKPLVDIPRLGEMAREMLHNALDAFVHRDLARVERVISGDDSVDALYARMRKELQFIMQEDPSSVLHASYLLFVAHYLERICDHCTNIAERVEFMETGEMKRVTPKRSPKDLTTLAPVRITASSR
ncbi:MAG: phosphate signaling complex protein PhoU [Oxalobacteraceae bacterium]|nr:MAG: phosphate signaling complex protein PhoU [Oxalobacteraceae bacterium]